MYFIKLGRDLLNVIKASLQNPNASYMFGLTTSDQFFFFVFFHYVDQFPSKRKRTSGIYKF
ncbi:hypothetical protein EfmAA290_05570 [Enterococcus faecium]|nr:hypothetical protein EfmAA290_05570 [Enterococcus faecium]